MNCEECGCGVGCNADCSTCNETREAQALMAAEASRQQVTSMLGDMLDIKVSGTGIVLRNGMQVNQEN